MADAKPKVLLVEDDPFMTTLLYEYLVKDGFEVISAGDGEEAVKQFKKSTPDVMLIDILLPKKNGLEALREIRALPGGDRVPAMILSNLEEVAYQKEAQELNAKAYLVKANVQLPEIVAKVKEILKD
ncbi:MAG: response regulator transcription factor [Candidatus Sungbacteria bacterium]|uniref:Response regulator transcription factor n=1 Tax=Candidatus Sungiibacteriota bacterium TaxID=2750080 RepID=A0A932YXS1_9BACT|nr:response regulator transcription factor [Candidatus Sungbacteria bacterium]